MQNFKFQKIYGENTHNTEVFDNCKDLITKSLAGQNCTIFAYG